MKKVYVLLLFFVPINQIFGQNTPLVRDVYDFAVGDTLQYRGGTNNGGQWTYTHVILDRSDHGSDSIEYLVKRIYCQGNSQCNWFDISNSRLIVYYPDSVYYKATIDGWNYDSSFMVMDSLSRYGALFKRGQSVFCTLPGSGDSYTNWVTVTKERIWTIGLGLVSEYSCTDPVCNYCQAERLIYAHKANGYVYGSPQDYLTGVQDIKIAKIASITPNPITTYYEVKLDLSSYHSVYFSICDAVGRLISYEPVLYPTSTFSRENIGNGIYFWAVESEGRILDKGKMVFE